MIVAFGAPRHPFVGRERERRLLGGLVGGTPTGGGTAVIRGEAGIGKTALLKEIAAASPVHVLWVRGVESEAVLPFAAVSDLLVPLRGVFDHLPQVQREALEVSLALSSGTAVSPLAVCAAALGVLAAAGEQQPLLVLIDDFQWVDPSSQQVLLFVARRLSSERVIMLLTVRDQPGDETAELTLPTLHLAGLSVQECHALIATLRVEVSSGVLEKIVEQTGGNPLAVIETVRAAPPEGLRGCGADFAGPSLGPSLQRIWSDVIDDLPEPTRVALFVLAASQSSTQGGLGPVLEGLGVSLADLVPAERNGLLRVSPHAVELRHPLLRPVILECTPLSTRLVAYQALAQHAEGDLRAWYLAASVTGPDDTVADSLVVAAVAARERSGYHTSARTWGRAAELTIEPHRRAERLLAAANDAQLAGELDLARAWCEDALALRADPCFAADVELVRGRSHTWLGNPLRAVDDFVRAGEAVLDRDSQRAARLYAEAVLPCAMAGRVSDSLALARRGEAAEVSGGARSLLSVTTTAVSLVLAGHTTEARHHLTLGEQLAKTADPLWDLQNITLLGQSRVWLEEHHIARTLFGGVIDVARRASTPSVLALALGGRGELDWWTGRWAAAYADVTEALHWAEELGQVISVSYALSALGRLDAARGEVALCRQRQDQALHHIGPYGIDSMGVHISSVLGFAALGASELDTAVQHLDQAWGVAQDTGLGATNVVPFAGDLVEAHIRAGNTGRACEALAWLDERVTATGLVYPAAAAARCRGLLADNLDLATRHFAEAIALHQRCPMPFEHARTLLCEAETLRRLRRPAAARPLLRQALTVFDGLGARPWAARAEIELAATGARPTPGRDNGRPGLDVLTPQEFQIARTVAEGLNNSETAAALFISRKTVEAHLTRVYRKLGVRSRTELARLLAHTPPGVVPPSDPGDTAGNRLLP